MAEYKQQLEHEQYPLLKVDGAAGDNNISIPKSPPVSPEWTIKCSPKQLWCIRWPEFVSTCWMTIMLLAISFLVFYALGMSAYKRHPVIIVNCNDTRPASNVFYHSILSQDYIPFSLYSQYLSFMAKEFPLLRFHVYFLIDDAWHIPTKTSRRPRFLKKLIPHIAGSFETVFKQNNKREIRDFQKTFQNVNISVIYLSKYMEFTPLKNKWRLIPQKYLPFYARIYEIWKNGGVGFDLVTFNNKFNNDHKLDRRVDAILKEHSRGIETEKYAKIIDSFDNDDQIEIFGTFFDFINHMFNQTYSFINAEFKSVEDNSEIKAQREKRNIVFNSNPLRFINNGTQFLNNSNGNILSNVTLGLKKENFTQYNSSQNNETDLIQAYDVQVKNISQIPQVLFFYDIPTFADEVGPPYLLQDKHSIQKYPFQGKQKPNYLLLSPDGEFVAASSRYHPFLGQLFSSGCYLLDPKYAIRDLFLSQCSGFFKDDIYCDNIHVVYNIV